MSLKSVPITSEINAMTPEEIVTDESEDLIAGTVLGDRYRIVRKLGEGGMGAVYEGEHTLIKRRVAIKCLHARYAREAKMAIRFKREAMAATAIGHPNIVECTDMGRTPDGSLFMVLELLQGTDWARELDRTGPQPLSRVVHILSQVCDAVGAAHDKGIVHRDLKPENIFLIRRGSDSDFVKVLDFGISKFVRLEDDVAETQKKLTRTGTAIGTPLYMSPEQIQGSRAVDHRTDIYSLGVILFQALTSRLPYEADSHARLLVQALTEEPASIERYRMDLPTELNTLISRMLARDPARRPAGCADVKAALAAFAAHDNVPVMVNGGAPTTTEHSLASTEIATPVSGIRPTRETPPATDPEDAPASSATSSSREVAPRSARREAALWGAASSALVAVIAIGAVWWFSARQPPAPQVAPPAAIETSEREEPSPPQEVANQPIDLPQTRAPQASELLDAGALPRSAVDRPIRRVRLRESIAAPAPVVESNPSPSPPPTARPAESVSEPAPSKRPSDVLMQLSPPRP